MRRGAETRGGSRGAPLENATRDELDEMAKKADIPGRSRTTKAELTATVRHIRTG